MLVDLLGVKYSILLLFTRRCILDHIAVLGLASRTTHRSQRSLLQEWLNLKRALEQKHLTPNCSSSSIPFSQKTTRGGQIIFFGALFFSSRVLKFYFFLILNSHPCMALHLFPAMYYRAALNMAILRYSMNRAPVPKMCMGLTDFSRHLCLPVCQSCVIVTIWKTILFILLSESGEKHERKSKTNYRSCVVYRRGQKQLTRLFLREVEHLLELSAKEQS